MLLRVRPVTVDPEAFLELRQVSLVQFVLFNLTIVFSCSVLPANNAFK